MPQEYPARWTPHVTTLFGIFEDIENRKALCALGQCGNTARDEGVAILGHVIMLCQGHYEEFQDSMPLLWSTPGMPTVPEDTPPAATWRQAALLTEHLMRVCRACGAQAEDGDWVVRVWDARTESEITYCPNCKEAVIRRLRRLRDERADQAERAFTASMVESLVFGDAVGIVTQGPPKEDQS